MIYDNPIRGRINAWFFSVMDGYMHWKYEALKKSLFEEAPQTVVELGSGTGANLRYLPEGSELIAIEPNIHMHPVLIKNAAKYGVKLDLRGLCGEQLDLPDDSVDFVFCTLVLCTVENPQQVIDEVRRVLKPGGRFVCIEHVKAPKSTFIGRIQNGIRRPWLWFFEGCDLCRNTGHLLETANFKSVKVDKFILPTIFVPIRHQIISVCIN